MDVTDLMTLLKWLCISGLILAVLGFVLGGFFMSIRWNRVGKQVLIGSGLSFSIAITTLVLRLCIAA